MKTIGGEAKEVEADDMGINVAGDTTVYNVTQPPVQQPMPKEKTAIGLGALLAAAVGGSVLPIAGLLLGYVLNKQPPAPPSHAHPSPIDSEYEVRFYDKDGNLIEVPHLSKRTP